MSPTFFNHSVRILAGMTFGITFLYAATTHSAVSQSPLSLTVGVPPNIILTLDDSGSMSWGFVPDSIESQVITGSSTHTITRLYAASEFNSLYYNPKIKYITPPTFDGKGDKVNLETNFNSAPINGFRPSDGNLDLSNNYKPTGKEYRMPKGAHQQANSPLKDFRVEVKFSRNETQTIKSAANIEFRVTRSSGNRYSCEILKSGPVLDTGNFFCSKNGNSDTYIASTPAYYYLFDDTLASKCEKEDENCYRLKFVENHEKTNFATWYSFYRTRALATLSATSLAFANLSPEVRLGWQNLAQCTKLDGSDQANCKDNKFRQYDSLHKGQFYSWLKDVYFNSGTPLPAAMIRAGEFLKGNVAWQKHPNSRDSAKENTTENTYACRPSYQIMMTDGMWNATSNNPSNFRHDNADFILPDNTRYTKAQPFKDETSSTLADLAMHYWATDLNTNLANKLTPYVPYTAGSDTENYWNPQNDPATWQHMSNFIMGLGLTSSMNDPKLPWEGSTFLGKGYDALKSGTAWPKASSGSNNNVYDLWHAAINSRGEFFSVDSPDAMVQAFEDILSRIAERKSTAARPAISSGLVVDDAITSVSYQTSYASDENWSGDLKRFSKKLVEVPNQDGTTRTVLQNTEDWSAKSKLPASGDRTIKIAGNTGLVDFTWGNAGDKSAVDSLAYWLSDNPETAGYDGDDNGALRLAYLRGDRSNEGGGTNQFRMRTSVLGDLYASSPVSVSGARYLASFANRLEDHVGTESNSYSAFLARLNGTAENTLKRPSRVYVGGNDGMLHGFDSETGVETFAFVPTAVFPKLNKLTGKNYNHEFFVDGSPVVADVFDGIQWRTILVGTLRAGGKALFALDITTPGSEQLLWEFDATNIENENAVKPGYSFSRPTIARLHNGRWAVVTGNGYDNGATDGKAALYVIDAINGTLTKSLEVSGTEGSANGLSSPTLADYDADGVADYAYAGDLQGNLWRFDLLGSVSEGNLYGAKNGSIENFAVSYGGSPMFRARLGTPENPVIQPITAAPTLIRHPSMKGYLVLIGTGKFFEDTDKEGEKGHAQSIYGIWDTKTKAEATSANIITRSQLAQQTITQEVTGTYSDGGTNPARIVSNNNIVWTTTTDGLTSINTHGWYLDLRVGNTLEGEMLVEKMTTLGQTVFFQTLVPNDDPCSDGTSNWTYAINPYTGGKTLFHAFDLKHIVDNVGNIVTAIKQDGEGGITLTQTPDNRYEACTGLHCETIYPDPSSLGRQTWRVVGN